MIQHDSQTDTIITSDIPGFICVDSFYSCTRYYFRPSDVISIKTAEGVEHPHRYGWSTSEFAKITIRQEHCPISLDQAAFEQFKRLMAQNQ